MAQLWQIAAPSPSPTCPAPRLSPPVGCAFARFAAVPRPLTRCTAGSTPTSSSEGKHSSTFPPAPSPSPSIATQSSYVHIESSPGGGNGTGPYNGHGGGGGGGRGDGGGDGYHGAGGTPGDSPPNGGLFAGFLQGWRERVRADPQFPFKVLMEEVVGVGACVIGDMASRPNFGLNELDFVFSTIVVGSILNFALMYMLAPTAASAAAASSLPSIFASCPPGHMFEHGAYSVLDRLGTFVYKGALFATVGFGAGLLGTFMSNFLISMRKKVDPSFEPQNKAPPTILNAATWALHMGLSSNLRYQVLNGLEFSMANVLPPPLFKASVLVTRAANNVLGGMSFVALARLTGSQKADGSETILEVQDSHASNPEPQNVHESSTESQDPKSSDSQSASVSQSLSKEVEHSSHEKQA